MGRYLRSEAGDRLIGLTLALLLLVFIALKLTGVIGWSWWWVLSPLWLPVAVILGLAALYYGYLAIVTLVPYRS